MGPAALVLLGVDTAADLVAGPDADGGLRHHHQGEGDEQQHQGGLHGGHFVYFEVRRIDSTEMKSR
ncbi:hypothetical protein P5F04_16235, partial [Clostridium perfringens]|nr:hypothetical protein [Clostridium perfringens]